jgi:hypothetical protein
LWIVMYKICYNLGRNRMLLFIASWQICEVLLNVGAFSFTVEDICEL